MPDKSLTTLAALVANAPPHKPSLLEFLTSPPKDIPRQPTLREQISAIDRLRH